MGLRSWGRAWDVLYGSGIAVCLVTGLVLPLRLGVALLGLALFLLVLAPVRGRPGVFWPVLAGYLGFAVAFTSVGLATSRPGLPGAVIGLAAAGLAAGTARAITGAQRRARQDQRGR